jgi:hypothetical protein
MKLFGRIYEYERIPDWGIRWTYSHAGIFFGLGIIFCTPRVNWYLRLAYRQRTILL